jgi:hypothetical protein
VNAPCSGYVCEARTITLAHSYDQLGNITAKTGQVNLGNYQYRTTPVGCVQAGPQAVSQIGLVSYCYDANGNQTDQKASTTDYRKIYYTGFDLPYRVERKAQQLGIDNVAEFKYDTAHAMVKRVDSAATTGVPDTILRSGFEDGEGPGGGGFTTSTIYVGNAEFVTRGTQSLTRRHVGGFLIVRNEGATTERNFLLKDHLGSIDTIVTDLGGIRLAQKMSFDAYGLRREAFQGNWNATSLAQQLGATESLNTTKGYTGHEQVDGVVPSALSTRVSRTR